MEFSDDSACFAWFYSSAAEFGNLVASDAFPLLREHRESAALLFTVESNRFVRGLFFFSLRKIFGIQEK